MANWSRLLGAAATWRPTPTGLCQPLSKALLLVRPWRGPLVTGAQRLHRVGANCSGKTKYRVEGVRDLKKEVSYVPSKGVVPANNGYVAKPSDRRDFEIAIICALEDEYEAVFLMLREFWDEDGDIYGRAVGDGNTYTTGRIGRFNIVLVLSGMGKAKAASAAARARCSYPNLRLAILVGICGGVPRTNSGEEIRLGDVVVSNTIIQYDYGTQYSDQFVRKSTSEDNNRETSHEIYNLLTFLRTHRGRSLLQIRAINCHQQLQTRAAEMGRRDIYSYSGSTRDNKQAHEPAIHMGRVASGDTVFRSSEHRDGIFMKEDAIAYEMEGAGVASVLPCIIIKGVSDYADSRKNDQHRNYSVATAAATLRALLEEGNSRAV